jgi:release factor glutamine methyltransferase
MKYNYIIEQGQKILKDQGIDPKLAILLGEEYFGASGIFNFSNISVEERQKYNKAIGEIIKGKPVQYILGWANFYGYRFKVSKDVLIPRKETEELVEQTIKYIEEKFNRPISIIDVGSGSGIIGITIKKEVKNIEVTLTDISKHALKKASYNAKTLEAKVNIIESNMLNEIIKQQKKYDVVISNPPYLKEAEAIMDIVKNNEPKTALFGGRDGLKFYRKLFKDVKKILNNKYLIALEIGSSQADSISKMIEKHLNDSVYEVRKDLQGRDRMIFIFSK